MYFVPPLIEFQSLFSWNLLLMWTSDALLYDLCPVSILVFVELALDAWGTCGGCYWFRFQSLFSWNLLLMVFSQLPLGEAPVSFNPCFRGTCSWWLIDWCACCLSFQFQSLFSWNLLLMVISEKLGHAIYDVSILVFVELALDVKTSKSEIFAPCGFNPCFRGTCSWWFVPAN